MIMKLQKEKGIRISASDVTAQNQVVVDDLPTDFTIEQALDGLVPRMQLPRTDSTGRPLTYHARLEREGRHLNRAERVGEALQPNDRIVLQPNIDAGSHEQPSL
jgi:hypothetical protein